ncbi:hypothetical protein [Phormidium tenue]|uniref:Uncharacterized protein n=1 Tax=Phormidium tenue NIES-30 TaxID=549789 RepID=A0A1U7J1V3_9CYAN|nr:hypothetical protein [Phormidium tenue]MBD2233665.1 hypothetical protein [Phormidium tenue FACHB-1052]OKH46087.1 hypothetical protein NIES30_17445 [Phormidium tenue NIES-30]
MADDISKQLKQLSNLTPEARARVSEALKANIEKELITGPISPGGSAAAFSRGILFSRSTSSFKELEETVINSAVELDDVKFKSFVERLSAIRGQQ